MNGRVLLPAGAPGPGVRKAKRPKTAGRTHQRRMERPVTVFAAYPACPNFQDSGVCRAAEFS